MNPSFSFVVSRPVRNAALVLCLAASSAAAQSTVPVLMSYQGRVTDASGALIGNSTPVNRTVTFRLYSAATGGSAVWAEAQTVTISGGEFSVLIGNGTGVSGTPGPSAPASSLKTLSDIINTATTAVLYLGITVDDGNAATTDPEVSPRQQLVSGAFSLRSRVAETVAGGAVTSAMIGDGAVTTNQIGAAAVNNAKLADTSVTTAKIMDASINTAKLADASVATAKLINGSVTGDKIADGTVGTVDLAPNAVTGEKIADGTVTSGDLADGTVATADLANGAVDINKLVAAVKESLCPAGTISAFAGDTAPAGWLLCDGTEISRTTYATLFNTVGSRFGSGNGTSTFRIPDFRGRFLRGRDNSAGRDEDRASRTAMNTGGATGDAVGSLQEDLFKAHYHTYGDIYYSEKGGTVSVTSNKGSGDSDSDNAGYEMSRNSNNTGGSETRPENASVNYIIKY